MTPIEVIVVFMIVGIFFAIWWDMYPIEALMITHLVLQLAFWGTILWYLLD